MSLKMSSFNPLRPSLAGDTDPSGSYERTGNVSIHSGHRWPEIPEKCSTWTRMPSFQSTPAIAGRRYAVYALAARICAVSIHSGHRWPEIRAGREA